MKDRLLKKLSSSNHDVVNEAFEEIYKKYYKLVCFVSGKYLLNNLDIEDVAYDSFMSLYLHRQDVHDIKYYLLTTCKNKSINLAKKLSPIGELDEDNLSSDHSSYHSSYMELISLMKKILNEEDVEIITSHVLEGISLKQIAQKKNISLNTIKSRYSRGLKKVNKQLENLL
jgi:RNA polymerase sigma-70 factor (ECF subfamily)